MRPESWQPQAATIPTNNVQSCLEFLGSRLAQVSETPRLDAQVLLAHLSGQARAWLLAHGEETLPAEICTEAEAAAARLTAGEPLPYLLGHWEFYSLDFNVSPHVLIPRPETELLVENALGYLQTRPGSPRVIDVGTGSGCIAIALASHLPVAALFASDCSPAALEVARRNAVYNQIAYRIHFFQSDLLSGIQATFDLICANLPYIPTACLADLPVAGHEPRLALDGGPDGLSLIRRLLSQAPRFLAPHGLLLLEIEYRQGVAVLELARQAFPCANIQLHQDLHGLDRLVAIQNRAII